MNRRTALLVLTLAVSVSATASAQATAPRPKPAQLPADSMEIARKYTQWLYTSQSDSLVAHLDAGQREKPGMKAQYDGLTAQLATRAGTEKSVVEEKFITRNGARQYWRTAMFSDFPQPLLLRWVIGPKGELMGVGLGPLTEAPPIDP